MSNVIPLNMVTSLDIPADRVLDAAKEAGLTRVVVMGYCEDGSEYFASSVADGGEVVWMIERSKLKLLRLADG